MMSSWWSRLFPGAAQEKAARKQERARKETKLTFWFMDYTMSVFDFALRSVVFDGNSKDGDYARRSYMARWNRLLTETMMNAPVEQHQGHYRVLTALREGVGNGVISLDDEDDVKLMDKLIHSNFAFCPALVEDYLESGELADALRLLVPREMLDGRLPNDPGGEPMMAMTRTLRVGMFRLYYYDTMRAREYDANKDEGVVDRGDDENHQDLPLEIRLSFSGFFEPVTFAEVRWDVQVRQQRLSPDVAFGAYERLHCAQMTGGNMGTPVPADDSVDVGMGVGA